MKEMLYIEIAGEYWVLETTQEQALDLAELKFKELSDRTMHATFEGIMYTLWLGAPYRNNSKYIGCIMPLDSAEENAGVTFDKHGFNHDWDKVD